jgi:hypothetical protein
MYNEFCVNSIYTDLSTKTIVIETNFKVDAKSVDYETVKLVNTESGLLENYKLSVEDSKIILTFNDWPLVDVVYQLSVSNIKDMLRRDIKSALDRKIIFESDVKSKVAIVQPVHNDAIKTKTIEIEINVISEEDEVLDYRYDISSDVAFFNIINSIKSPELSISTSLNNGQYYLRVRGEYGDRYGDWSEPISFLVIANESNESDLNNDFIDDLITSNDLFVDLTEPVEIVDKTPNGKSSNEFYIVLNKDINVPTDTPLIEVQVDPNSDITEQWYLLKSFYAYRRDF